MFIFFQIEAETGRKLKYKQVYQGVMSCISFLKRYDIQENDVIALCLPTIPEFAMLYIAIAACKAIVTTCNPGYTESKNKIIFI